MWCVYPSREVAWYGQSRLWILPRCVCLKEQAQSMISIALQCWSSGKYHPQAHTQCEQRRSKAGVQTMLLHLAKQWSPSARQILSGKGPKKAFCRLLIQWHAYKRAHTQCLRPMCFAAHSSSTKWIQLYHLPLQPGWIALPTQPLLCAQTSSCTLLHRELEAWVLVSFSFFPF